MPLPSKPGGNLSENEIDGLRVGLKHYVDVRFVALQREMEKNEQVIDVRLASMNEFRQAMQDQQNKYLTMTEHDAWKNQVENKLSVLHDFKTELKSKAPSTSVWFAIAISVLALITSVVALIREIIELGGIP